ncbi:MAG TPA: 50S ribosomal protein L29 [Anaerolineales bacterium]
MKPEEIRALSTEDIQARLDDAKEELMKLRFQLAMGGLNDYTRLRYTRKSVARLMTILNERQFTAQEEGEA